MLRLITGTPGAGKSLRAMWWLTQDEYLDDEGEPRPVYSNIPGTSHHPLPEGDDWTKTPEGSVVIYDEAQQFFPSTGRAGNSDDPRIKALETHRHTGHDLIFLTQRYALIHHHIRALCGAHEHLVKRFGPVSVIFSNGEVFDPKDRNKITSISESTWKHPKKLFDQYRSSSLHTKAQTKTRIPGKLKFLGVTILLLGTIAAWAGYQSFQNIGNPDQHNQPPDDGGAINVASTDLAEQSTEADSNPSEPVPAWRKKGHEGLSGCVSSDSGCQCFDQKGLRVELPEHICRNEIQKPMISRITGFDSRGERKEPES